MNLGGCDMCSLLHHPRRVLQKYNKCFIIDEFDRKTVRHILICPIEHIESIDDLEGKKDVELVKEMYKSFIYDKGIEQESSFSKPPIQE